MQHDYRHTNQSGGNDGFVLGVLTGAVIGMGLGIFFAPRAGSELRARLKEQARDAMDRGFEEVRRNVDQASPSEVDSTVNPAPETASGPARRVRVKKSAD